MIKNRDGLDEEALDYGLFFVKGQGKTEYDRYYSAVLNLERLISDEESDLLLEGIYLSSKDSWCRLTYIVQREQRSIAHSFIHDWIDKNKELSLYKSSKPTPLTRDLLISKFRTYLYTYTRVGLNLLSFNISYAQKLMVWIRYIMNMNQTLIPEQTTSDVQTLHTALSAHSEYFYSLSPSEKQVFIENLTKFDNNDWAHMMVNFILRYDPRNRFTLTTPILPTPEMRTINEDLKQIGIPVIYPDGWNPRNIRDAH
ncbi:MAG: hypothetical protein GF411_15910 [Candidatus Lokiarchaeota archaeon]|nr:hypothetical protein [Candidatus Lokiarchaeota archaeon]